jgi:hypothetical protein
MNSSWKRKLAEVIKRIKSEQADKLGFGRLLDLKISDPYWDEVGSYRDEGHPQKKEDDDPSYYLLEESALWRSERMSENGFYG